MNPRPELRIGDAERLAATEALGEHYAAGRLTKEEYDERSAVAWAARTNSDLYPLFADLPAIGGATPAVSVQQSRASRPGPWPQPAPRPRSHRVPWLPLILLVLGLSLLFDGAWWLLLVAAFVFSRGHRRGCHQPHRPHRST